PRLLPRDLRRLPHALGCDQLDPLVRAGQGRALAPRLHLRRDGRVARARLRPAPAAAGADAPRVARLARGDVPLQQPAAHRALSDDPLGSAFPLLSQAVRGQPVTIALEFARGTRARRSLAGGSWPGAFGSLVARNRRRYGGYVVHAAVVLLAIGIAGSSAYQTVRERRLQPGQSMKVAGYTLAFQG